MLFCVEKRKYKIYLHTNLINGKKYVGQTIRNVNERWLSGNGYKPKKDGDSHFYNAIQKYGWNNFKHEILKKNLTAEDANYWEIYYIKYFDTANPEKGYNKTFGGQNGIPTLETREKMKDNHANLTGGKNPKARKIICIDTNECFDCIKDASIKYNLCESDIRQVCKNRRHTTGGLRFCYYENFNTNLINKPIIRKTNSKPIICLETQEIFKSAKDAQRKLNIDNSSILKNCKQKLKSAGKLHFKFYKEEL